MCSAMAPHSVATSSRKTRPIRNPTTLVIANTASRNARIAISAMSIAPPLTLTPRAPRCRRERTLYRSSVSISMMRRGRNRVKESWGNAGQSFRTGSNGPIGPARRSLAAARRVIRSQRQADDGGQPRMTTETAGQTALLPDLVSLPDGWFTLGSEHGRPDERPLRRIFVSPFALARTPVTNAAYARFVAAGGRAPRFWRDPRFSHPDQPVVGVRWQDAVDFCAWLSA